jgi:aspartyl-tRNA(Asn)/glutamyl-tRNA(Gln) amidotransferase subunit C
MTQISRDDVLHLAQLSNLELNDSEVDGLRTDISNILGYVEQLNKLNVENVEPTYQVTGLQNVWRDDTVINYGVTREELLARAPELVGSQIKVPKVL